MTKHFRATHKETGEQRWNIYLKDGKLEAVAYTPKKERKRLLEREMKKWYRRTYGIPQ